MTLQLNNFLLMLASEIDQLTNRFVFDGYQALSDLLKAPLASLIVLYIVLMGYAVARGIVERPQQSLFKFAIRAGLIYMFAMNWDFFASHAKDLLVIGSESVASTLMKAVHKGSTGTSINAGLQSALNDVLQLGFTLFEEGSYRKLIPYIAAYMVILTGSITVGLAFIEIIIAKLMLSLTLCTAPLFVIFLLFDETKSFFERWLGVLTGFAFALIFVSAVVGLCMHLLHWVTTGILANENIIAAGWVPMVIISILCVMGIMQAVAIGKSIGGSLCTSGGAAMVAGFIGGAITAGGVSKAMANRSLRGTTSVIQKSMSLSGRGHALFKQMQKNLRRGNE